MESFAFDAMQITVLIKKLINLFRLINTDRDKNSAAYYCRAAIFILFKMITALRGIFWSFDYVY